VPEALVPHKVFTGNRPSSSLLVGRLDAYTTGQLLALFEHRCARATLSVCLFLVL
jgi:glucose-6-phosphate isomerase